MESVSSIGELRTVNNTLRHQYRVLSDEEKAQMQAIKDKGLEFLELIESLRSPPTPIPGSDMVMGTVDRELVIATERLEEAVMWAVRHITK
jgi:hypothetical protein